MKGLRGKKQKYFRGIWKKTPNLNKSRGQVGKLRTFWQSFNVFWAWSMKFEWIVLAMPLTQLFSFAEFELKYSLSYMQCSMWNKLFWQGLHGLQKYWQKLLGVFITWWFILHQLNHRVHQGPLPGLMQSEVCVVGWGDVMLWLTIAVHIRSDAQSDTSLCDNRHAINPSRCIYDFIFIWGNWETLRWAATKV